MDIGIVASRYAKTLLRFAIDNKEEDVVYEEMRGLAGIYHKVPALRATLANPSITAQKQAEIILAAATGTQDATQTTQKFVALVTKNRRAELMQFIATAYESQYLRHKNITVGSLTVPVAVSDKTKEQLKQMVEARTNSTMQFRVNIDPEIEGGFILQYDTYRLDASLRTQLQHIRRKLS